MPVKIDGTGYIGTANNIYTDGSGRVGIGTSAPAVPLHISHTSVPARFETNTAYNYLQFANTSTPEVGWFGYGSSDQNIFGVWNNRPGDMRFATTGTERLRIDSSGRVTMPYQPCFYAFRNAGNVTGAAVFIFNDTYTNIGGHYNTTTGRFTAPVAGNYSFTNFMLTNSSSRCQWSLRKNGNAYAVGEMQAGTWQNGSLSVILTLAVNDYIDVYINSASDVGYGSGYNGLIGQLIG